MSQIHRLGNPGQFSPVLQKAAEQTAAIKGSELIIETPEGESQILALDPKQEINFDKLKQSSGAKAALSVDVGNGQTVVIPLASLSKESLLAALQKAKGEVPPEIRQSFVDSAAKIIQGFKPKTGASSPKIAALLDQAETLKEGKHYQKALQVVNQALKINPRDAEALHKKATLLFLTDHRAESVKAYEDVIQVKPQDPSLNYSQLYTSYMADQSSEDVIALADRLIETHETGDKKLDPAALSDTYTIRAEKQLALGHYRAALADSQQAIALNPKPEGWAHRVQGDAYLKLGQYDQAIAAYDEALKIDPADKAATKGKADAQKYQASQPQVVELLEKSKTLKEAKNYAGALKQVEQALKLNPHDGEALHLKATLLFLTDRRAESLKAYEAAIQVNPQDPSLNYSQLYASYMADQSPEDVMALANRLIETHETGDKKLDPAALSDTYTIRAEKQLALGHYRAALADSQQAIALNPKPEGWAHRVQGDAYLKLGQYDQAIAAYDEALKIDPTDQAATQGKADVKKYQASQPRIAEMLEKSKTFKEAKDFQNALGLVNQALELNPHDADALRERSLLLYQINRRAEAAQLYETVIQSKPQDPNLNYTQLYMSYGADQSPKDVIALADRLIKTHETGDKKLDPAALSDTYTIRAEKQLALGHYRAALADSQQAIALNPKPEGWAHRVQGDAYRKLGQYDQAIAAYNEALKIDPNDKAAAQAKAQAESVLQASLAQ